MITWNGFSLNNGGSTLIPKDYYAPGPYPHPIPDWVKELPIGTFRFEFTAQQTTEQLESYWESDGETVWTHVSGNVYDYLFPQNRNMHNLPENTKIIAANLSGFTEIPTGNEIQGTYGLTDIDNFYAPDLTGAEYLVRECRDLSSFYGDLSNVTNFYETFQRCSFTGVPAIDFGKAENMDRTFFEGNLQWIRTLKTPNLTSCWNTFESNPIAKGIEPQYEMWSGIDQHTGCFRNCTADPYYSYLAQYDQSWV